VPDQTFGSGGVAAFANLSGHSTSVAEDPLNGEIYMAGFNTPPNAVEYGVLAALTPTGALDTAFGGGAGYVLGDATGEGTVFYDVAVQTVSVNGQTVSRVLVAGQSAVQMPVSGFVAAYTLGGALDTTFGNGGSFMLTGVAGGTAPSFTSLVVEADGSIVVGGGQTYGYDSSEMLIGHLTASGVADTSFGPDGTGFTTVQDGTQIGNVRGLAIDPTSGDILACGDSTDSNGYGHGTTIRLTAS
jgi:uncharacterized delta-60 repeat protein